MKSTSHPRLKFSIALLAAVLLWLAPFGKGGETARPQLEIFPLAPALIQALPGDASAACAPSCMEEVCLAWVPIGGSCQPTNPWDIGCCTLYGTVCNEELPGCGPEEPPPPPVYSPPTVSAQKLCTSYGPSGWCLQDGSIRITASDPQGFAVTITGIQNGMGLNTPIACTSPCIVGMLPGSGFVTFTATAETSGLSSSQGSIMYSFDPTPPYITHNTSGTRNGSWYTSSLATESISINDSISGMQSSSVTLNGAPASNNFPLAEGDNNISITARDLAGHQAVVSYVVQKDSLKPVLSLTVSGTQNGTWYRSATVSASASDATSGVQSLLITDNGTQVTAPITLSEGTHTITATATDRAGLVQSQSMTVRVDGTAPSVTPSFSGTAGNNGWYTSVATASLSASDPGSGLASLRVSLNGAAFQAYSTPIVIGEGMHTLRIEAADNAGNVIESSRSINIDSTPPSLAPNLNGTPGANDWYISMVSLQAASSDTLSGLDVLEHRLDGGAWQPGSTLECSLNGEHLVEFRARDRAGNEVSASRSFRIDGSPPELDLLPAGSPGQPGWYRSAVLVSSQSSDPMSGLADVEYSLDGTTWQALPSVLVLQDGKHLIQARARDMAGNLTRITRSIQIDTLPPELGISLDGTQGVSGWYISGVMAQVQARDETSEILESSLNDNLTQRSDGTLLLEDGIHDLTYSAMDQAGNQASAVLRVLVDSTPPLTSITSPAEGSALKGSVILSGNSMDETSGLFTTEISFDGEHWIPLPAAANPWTLPWETGSLANGSLTLYARSVDQAGNIGVAAQRQFILANQPPSIHLSESWEIWESGSLSVQANIHPLSLVKIVIHDPLGRQPDRVYFEGDHSPGRITWDRVIGGMIAPPGTYQVQVEACDIHGVCSQALAMIRVPEGAPATPPAATDLLFPMDVDHPARIQPAAPVPLEPEEIPEASAPAPKPQPLWPGVVLLTLVLFFGFQLVSDPRPAALRHLTQTIQPFIRSES